MADKLAQQAEHMQPQMREKPPMYEKPPLHEKPQVLEQPYEKKGSPQGGAEFARLQAEIQELRQALRKLNARLDSQKAEQR
jgi:hypothetical protein